MENTAQDAYLNPPRSRQDSFHDQQAQHCATSSISACSEATIKPYPMEPPAYANLNSLPISYYNSSSSDAQILYHAPLQQSLANAHTPPDYCILAVPPHRPSYSDDETDDDDEEVPLTHFLLDPRDAPPAYSTVVRQTYLETLSHTPLHPVVVDIDEEAGLATMRTDDLRFQVESLVAMAVVMALLILGGLLLGLLFLRR